MHGAWLTGTHAMHTRRDTGHPTCGCHVPCLGYRALPYVCSVVQCAPTENARGHCCVRHARRHIPLEASRAVSTSSGMALARSTRKSSPPAAAPADPAPPAAGPAPGPAPAPARAPAPAASLPLTGANTMARAAAGVNSVAWGRAVGAGKKGGDGAVSWWRRGGGNGRHASCACACAGVGWEWRGAGWAPDGKHVHTPRWPAAPA